MLDQVRSEFGVEVEIVDANLAGAWAPEGQRPPRLLAGPALRAIGLDVLRAGRASVVSVEGREYQLVPLRNSRSVSPTALMAMRVSAAEPAPAWPRHCRRPHVLEARGMRHRGTRKSRGLRCFAAPSRPTFRVVKKSMASGSRRGRCEAHSFCHVSGRRHDAREVAEAAIQAAAVWFDADARVYRRRPGGEYVARGLASGSRCAARRPPTVGARARIRRAVCPVGAPVAGLPGGREGIVVPMAASGPVEWALVLLGAVPAEADVTLEALGRVLGVQMERLALVRAAAARTGFEDVLVRGNRAAELIALDLLRELVSQTSGIGAAAVDSGRRGAPPHGRGGSETAAATAAMKTSPRRRCRFERFRSAQIAAHESSFAPRPIRRSIPTRRSWLMRAHLCCERGFRRRCILSRRRRRGFCRRRPRTLRAASKRSWLGRSVSIATSRWSSSSRVSWPGRRTRPTGLVEFAAGRASRFRRPWARGRAASRRAADRDAPERGEHGRSPLARASGAGDS